MGFAIVLALVQFVAGIKIGLVVDHATNFDETDIARTIKLVSKGETGQMSLIRLKRAEIPHSNVDAMVMLGRDVELLYEVEKLVFRLQVPCILIRNDT
jgi:hypothetical protein